MVSSVLNEACAIFSRSDSLCILMTLTEWLLPDGGRQKPLESEQDKDPPRSLRPLLITVICINIVPYLHARAGRLWIYLKSLGRPSRPPRQRGGDRTCYGSRAVFEIMSKYHIQEYWMCTRRMICRGCKHPYSCTQFGRVNRWFPKVSVSVCAGRAERGGYANLTCNVLELKSFLLYKWAWETRLINSSK